MCACFFRATRYMLGVRVSASWLGHGRRSFTSEEIRKAKRAGPWTDILEQSLEKHAGAFVDHRRGSAAEFGCQGLADSTQIGKSFATLGLSRRQVWEYCLKHCSASDKERARRKAMFEYCRGVLSPPPAPSTGVMFCRTTGFKTWWRSPQAAHHKLNGDSDVAMRNCVLVTCWAAVLYCVLVTLNSVLGKLYCVLGTTKMAQAVSLFLFWGGLRSLGIGVAGAPIWSEGGY